jgi:signal transduction histidine kinase
MSLTTRVSFFFLTALAVVLVGFSVALYLLADRYLSARAGHRLDAAVETLVAATEVHPGDVEWEPLERRITLGDDPAPDQVRWTVHDASGRLIDCSANLDHPAGGAGASDPGWLVLVRRLRAGNFTPERIGGPGPGRGTVLGGTPAAQVPGSVALPGDRSYRGDALVLTVALSEQPLAAELRSLAAALAGVSAATWLGAAACGRFLCRRALAPITRMAASARAIRWAGDAPPLDVAPSGDELEDLGRAFNDLLADLRRTLERQRRFTGDASHQLRTPLAALLAAVDVALRRERPAAEYQRVLGAVRRRGDQLRQITESLLFLARADTDAPLPDRETIDLVAWGRDWISSWSDHPRAADIGVRTEPDRAPVRANPAVLGQVLDNLLDNACKYSEPGTPVEVSVTVRGRDAVLSVADHGCGIAPADVPHLGDPFFRAAHARRLGVPGVGLGLAVARRLVTLLGGRLEVESEHGSGTTFRVVLSVDPVAEPQTGQGAGPSEAGAGAGRSRERGI